MLTLPCATYLHVQSPPWLALVEEDIERGSRPDESTVLVSGKRKRTNR